MWIKTIANSYWDNWVTMPSPHDRIIHDLIDATEKVLEQIEENWSSDLKTAKKFAADLREELEELLEEHDNQE